MPAVEQITIAGFKSFDYHQTDLRPLNILIGDNGSGKSNFLEAFTLLQAEAEDRLELHIIQRGGPHCQLRQEATSLRINVRFAGQPGEHGIALQPAGQDRMQHDLGLAPGIRNKAAKDAIRQWRIHHFQDTGNHSPLKRTVDLHDNHRLREDGGNLPAILYLLQQKRPAQFHAIQEAVRRINPSFGEFILAPRKLNQDKIRLEWRTPEAGQPLDVSTLSDGALRFAALATLLLQPKGMRPSLILLDEPELGLPPTAIAQLAAMIKNAADAGNQVITATQSPGLLNHFAPEDVLMTKRMNGATRITRLDPEQTGNSALGELWERNEL